jgi:ABC-type phosphate transport system auxiliary subunit
MSATEGHDPASESTGGSLAAITARLEKLAAELEGELDDERAAELVREASELAARAGQEVDAALRAAAEAREG